MSPGLRRLPWMPLALFVGAACFAGCSGESGDDDSTLNGDDDDSTLQSPTPTATPCTDADQDGACASLDCNDNDGSIHPGAPDVCDAERVDSNCDGVDACTQDTDGDGYCTEATGCTDGSLPGDCNDTDTSVHPGASEGSTCDGIDQDCDQTPDNGTNCYDDDHDGYSETQGDCDDHDPAIFPGAPERFDGRDNDCNPSTGESVVTVTPDRATVIVGEKKNEKVGWSLAGVPNLVAPGSVTLVVGAPGQSGAGAIGLYFASSTWAASSSISAAPVLIKESQAAAKTGWSVANAGDLNGDGLNDIVVGAPYYDLTPNITDSGRAYAILGRADGFTTVKDMDSAAACIMPGYFNGVYLGFSVAGGNINADEFDDMIVGAPQTSNTGNYGWLFTMPGRPTLPASANSGTITILQGSGDQQLGEACGFVGDTDDDGYGDYVCGGAESSNKEGFAIWFPGLAEYKPGTQFKDYNELRAVQLGGKVNLEAAGASKDLNTPGNTISGNGDVDNDGYPDFIVADGGPTKSLTDPIAFLFLGGSKFLGGSVPPSGASYKLADEGHNILIMPGPNDTCPCSVSIAGDMNQDGYDDILVGTSGSTNGAVASAGRVYLILGRATLPSSLTLESDANYILEGGTQGEQFGLSVAWAGDLNQDGYDDFAIGAPGAAADESTDNSGRVYLMFGFDAPSP